MTNEVGPAAIHRRAHDLLEQGRRVVLATVVAVEDSAPLDVGASMLVDDVATIEGSVTGGCVEGAVVERAQAVLEGAPAAVATFGIGDDVAGEVGLMCGGTVRIFVRELGPPARSALDAAVEAGERDEPAALVTSVDGEWAGWAATFTADARAGRLGGPPQLEDAVARDALLFADAGVSGLRRYGADGTLTAAERTVFVQAFGPRPRLVVVGAIDHTAALARIAPQLGYRVIVCDPRRAFARGERFAPAEMVVEWPGTYLAGERLGRRDAVLVLSHDRKLDEPALIGALGSGAGYVGAMGSRRTHADRLRRLRDQGVSEGDLARIASPCGLDIGARTPAEVAVSILAEITARSTGRHGEPLAEMSGPIRPRGEELVATAPAP